MNTQRKPKTWVSGPPSGSPGEEILRDLYINQKLSYADIASRYGITKTTVKRWFRAAGIPARDKREAQILSGKYGVQSEEHREALRRGAAKARAKVTPESHRKQSETLRRTHPGAWNKGKAWSPEMIAKFVELRADPEYRRKMSEMFTGEKSPNWKGGVKPELARRLDRAEWRRIRATCYERDNWTCQDCGCKALNTRDSKTKPKCKIQCHHIIGRRNGGTDDLENLVTLCMSCHHKRERREKVVAN